MKHHLPKSDGDEAITCPACQTLNQTHAEFCRECGYAFGFATLDPIQTVRSEGSFLKKWVERPSRTALAVTWIFHLPLVAVCTWLAIYLVLNRSELGNLPSFVCFWISIGFAYVGVIILYRSTRNYLRHRKPNQLL